MNPARLLGLLLALGLAGPIAAGAPPPVKAAPAAPVPCAPNGKLGFVCGVTAVEDLVAVPGGRWIIGSSMQPGAGVLYLIDPAARTAKPASIAVAAGAGGAPYAGCAAPDLKGLSTHGLDLRAGAGAGGRHVLYAVNHAGRESVEVFQVDASGTEPKIAWTGCVVVPAGVGANSLASLPDGGFVVSKFQDAGDSQAIVRLLNGEATGAVFRWTPGKGFSEVPGLRLVGDNGLVVSPDGRWLFVAVWGEKAVRRVALDGSAPSRTVQVDFRPDNLRWAPDGTFLAAGQHYEASNRPGPHGWGVARIDPETMTATKVADEAGRPGYDDATTALQVGKEIWLGSYRGDRIAYMAID